MKVLVIGNGGREHAMCHALKQSALVKKIYAAPANPGIKALAEEVDLKLYDLEGLCHFAIKHAIDLTIVGPEYPLSIGIVDHFKAQGLRIIGASRAAARLESSKKFAKEVMARAGVRTAAYQIANSRQELEGLIVSHEGPVVLKCDGLASGKGVFVCQTRDEANRAADRLFSDLKAKQVIFEEFIKGVESSFIVVTDGQRVVPLASSHDYKRLKDDDLGPNTGGMGSVSPTPRLTSREEQHVIESVIRPVLRQMINEGCPFSGFLYAGLIKDDSGNMHVLEFNARMGDPECQSVLVRLESDILDLFMPLSDPDSPLSESDLRSAVRWSSKQAVTIVMASEGYPDDPRRGDRVEGIEKAASLSDVFVFQAGTALDIEGRIKTAGGRVLNVTALGDDIRQARAKAYQAASMISFKGRQLRQDIGL
jgi:phosphoribosylamine--glycine ligase